MTCQESCNNLQSPSVTKTYTLDMCSNINKKDDLINLKSYVRLGYFVLLKCPTCTCLWQFFQYIFLHRYHGSMSLTWPYEADLYAENCNMARKSASEMQV